MLKQVLGELGAKVVVLNYYGLKHPLTTLKLRKLL